MAQSTINIRMDADLKHSFERLCKDIGITMTTAITIFAKQSVRENKLPVSLSGDPFYSEANLNFLRQGIAELEAGKGILMSEEEFDAFAKQKVEGHS